MAYPPKQRSPPPFAVDDDTPVRNKQKQRDPRREMDVGNHVENDIINQDDYVVDKRVLSLERALASVIRRLNTVEKYNLSHQEQQQQSHLQIDFNENISTMVSQILNKYSANINMEISEIQNQLHKNQNSHTESINSIQRDQKNEINHIHKEMQNIQRNFEENLNSILNRHRATTQSLSDLEKESRSRHSKQSDNIAKTQDLLSNINTKFNGALIEHQQSTNLEMNEISKNCKYNYEDLSVKIDQNFIENNEEINKVKIKSTNDLEKISDVTSNLIKQINDEILYLKTEHQRLHKMSIEDIPKEIRHIDDNFLSNFKKMETYIDNNLVTELNRVNFKLQNQIKSIVEGLSRSTSQLNSSLKKQALITTSTFSEHAQLIAMLKNSLSTQIANFNEENSHEIKQIEGQLSSIKSVVNSIDEILSKKISTCQNDLIEIKSFSDDEFLKMTNSFDKKIQEQSDYINDRLKMMTDEVSVIVNSSVYLKVENLTKSIVRISKYLSNLDASVKKELPMLNEKIVDLKKTIKNDISTIENHIMLKVNDYISSHDQFAILKDEFHESIKNISTSFQLKNEEFNERLDQVSHNLYIKIDGLREELTSSRWREMEEMKNMISKLETKMCSTEDLLVKHIDMKNELTDYIDARFRSVSIESKMNVDELKEELLNIVNNRKNMTSNDKMPSVVVDTDDNEKKPIKKKKKKQTDSPDVASGDIIKKESSDGVSNN